MLRGWRAWESLKWFIELYGGMSVGHKSTYLEYKHPIARHRRVIIINHIVNWPQLRSEICINRLSWHKSQKCCRVIIEGIDWTYLMMERERNLYRCGVEFNKRFDANSLTLNWKFSFIEKSTLIEFNSGWRSDDESMKKKILNAL